ncbi:hypothetical protein QBC42DRAFT_270861 [Cladorrhinum samala]|uniref:Uncharacterized protein n=1 Tax=Cladorrhinum samala TaxID=585594 RepID=A0AAV9HK12_9PEZI|nr:hypothetical protein QBC42DRAFT_270861 [Cladorrhinum samala]
MGSKRDYSAALSAEDYDDDHDQQPVKASSNKRRREQQSTSTKSKQTEAKTDPTYGQRTAFPGLDDGDMQLSDEDLEFEECGDALAYLKSVRQEARHVPHIIVAPKAGPQLPSQSTGPSDEIDYGLYENGVGDSRGYYQDGAYTAALDISPSPPSSPLPSSADHLAANNRAIREAYYSTLTTQFLSLRSKLLQTPSQAQINALPKDHGIEVGSFGARSWTFRVWTKRIRYTDPSPVQIAALDRQSVLKLIRIILGGKFIRRGYELRERTSRWIWALLARLPDRGELGYDEVGWVRELGKRAVLMMVSMAHMEALREEVDEDGLEGEDFEEEDEAKEFEVDEEGVGFGMPPTEDEEGEVVIPAGRLNSSSPLAGPEGEEEGEADVDIDDGEVIDDNDNNVTTEGSEVVAEDFAAIKARLLAKLEEATIYEEPPVEFEVVDGKVEDQQGRSDTTSEELALDEMRAKLNMRATLNMILTVAGEFYGQRDLLEFRDPFPAL